MDSYPQRFPRDLGEESALSAHDQARCGIRVDVADRGRQHALFRLPEGVFRCELDLFRHRGFRYHHLPTVGWKMWWTGWLGVLLMLVTTFS